MAVMRVGILMMNFVFFYRLENSIYAA